MTEKQFQHAVVEMARTLGWLTYHTHDSRRSAAGFPDLVLVRGGRVIFAELKTDKGKTTSSQDVWLEVLGNTEAEVYLWSPQLWPNIETLLK